MSGLTRWLIRGVSSIQALQAYKSISFGSDLMLNGIPLASSVYGMFWNVAPHQKHDEQHPHDPDLGQPIQEISAADRAGAD